MAGIRMSRWIGVMAVVGFGALLGACGPSKTEQALMDENKELRTKVGEIDSRVTSTEGNVNGLTKDVADLKSQPKAGPLIDPAPPKGPKGGGDSRPDGRRITLNGNLFPSGSDQLTAEGKKQIDAAMKGVSKGSSLTIEGFSDASKITKSKWPSNEALSEARAKSVAKYLQGKGYSIAGTEGFGAVTHNGKAPSRRVEIIVH